ARKERGRTETARAAARGPDHRLCPPARELVPGRTGTQGGNVPRRTETPSLTPCLQLRSCAGAAAQLRFTCGRAHFPHLERPTGRTFTGGRAHDWGRSSTTGEGRAARQSCAR